MAVHHQAAQLHAGVTPDRIDGAAKRIAVPEAVAEVIPSVECGCSLNRIVTHGWQHEPSIDLHGILHRSFQHLVGDESVLKDHSRPVLCEDFRRTCRCRGGGGVQKQVGIVGVDKELELAQQFSTNQQAGAPDVEIVGVTVQCGAAQGLILRLKEHAEPDAISTWIFDLERAGRGRDDPRRRPRPIRRS